MSRLGAAFDAIAIGVAALGVLVAFAIHVVHTFRSGTGKLVEYADGRAQAQRLALAKGEPSTARRFAGALCIATLIAILAYAFARKIHLI
jgi:hypothetical protein